MAESAGSFDSIDVCFMGNVFIVGANFEFIPFPAHPTRDRYQNNAIVFNVKIFIVFVEISWAFVILVQGWPPMSIFNAFEGYGFENSKDAILVLNGFKYGKAVND